MFRTLLDYFEVILAILLGIIVIRYILTLSTDRVYMPVSWKEAVKKGKVNPALVRTERKYRDKARFFNLWLQIERLRQDDVPGAFAELGVYRGETARIIHLSDPSRKLYLFDTFSGFKQEDLEKETGEAATYKTSNFADTTMERAKRAIGGNENVVFRPGYFPSSAEGLKEEAFALVNIDADLYNPIRAGLEFFYPRLVPGGVILVHDYNSKWEGAMKAVNEFASNIPETLVHVPDSDNTIMIIKNRSV